jgi:hypothetical protein
MALILLQHLGFVLFFFAISLIYIGMIAALEPPDPVPGIRIRFPPRVEFARSGPYAEKAEVQ